MVKNKLTDRQRQIYEFIRDHITQFGAPPTIREIGRKMNISSTNGVRQHLTAIIKKGYLKKQDHIARGIELVEAVARDIKRLPIVGTVPAGNPIDAIENMEGEIAFDASFLPKSDSFSLKVIGDSMVNAGILDGDIVIVQKQDTAQTGEIVVAVIGDEATVKRYYPDGETIRLQPENDAFDPIIISKNSPDFSIAGKVVGLIRKI